MRAHPNQLFAFRESHLIIFNSARYHGLIKQQSRKQSHDIEGMIIISHTKGKIYLFDVDLFCQNFIKIECLKNYSLISSDR
jgi:hypothetical protein